MLYWKTLRHSANEVGLLKKKKEEQKSADQP